MVWAIDRCHVSVALAAPEIDIGEKCLSTGAVRHRVKYISM